MPVGVVSDQVWFGWVGLWIRSIWVRLGWVGLVWFGIIVVIHNKLSVETTCCIATSNNNSNNNINMQQLISIDMITIHLI